LDGYHGDTARTFIVGEIDPKTQKLVNISKECMEAGINVVKAGQDFRKIAEAISEVAEANDLIVAKYLVGHGIGELFHDIPKILHARNTWDKGPMQPGMTFTIEPVVLEGDEDYNVEDDKWTISTVDRGWSAQHEHTVLVTNTGVEILTG